MASELSKGAGELECVDTLAVCFGIDPYGVLKLGKMKLVLLLISTSAARALWTGTRRVRAVSKGTIGGPLNLANSHPLAIPRGGQLGDSLAHECGEAAAYGFVYAIAAALTGGVAERVFPDYNEKKNAFLLTLEIALQAAFNAAVAQLVRAAVAQLRFIAGISAGDVAAAKGGIVFAFVTFTRQTEWKKKVQALDAKLDATRFL